MHSCLSNMLELVSPYTISIQAEVERLAARYNLRIDEDYSALEVKVEPTPQAQLGYTLWDDAGVISIKGKWQLQGNQLDQLSGMSLVVRFSLSYNPRNDLEIIKTRIDEYFGHDSAELHWNVSPIGHDDHAELSLYFKYEPKSQDLTEYVRYVLGMITGRILAA